MAKFVTFEGSFYWTKTSSPELSPFTAEGEPEKWFWKTLFVPADQENLMRIMDLQSMGVKNKIKKNKIDGEDKYAVNFNRPTQIKTRSGWQDLDPPKVFEADGSTPLDTLIGNGSKGKLTIELYEHGAPNGGKAHAARLYSITITDLVPYEGSPKPAESTTDTTKW